MLTIPARADEGRQGSTTVPLPPAAVAIMDELPRFTDGGFLFSTTAGKRLFSKVIRRSEGPAERGGRRPAGRAYRLSVPPWTLHDLRRTVRTGLSSLDVLPTVAELVLARGQQGMLGGLDLHKYDPTEARAALEAWADKVASIVGAAPDPEPARGNVVPLRGRGRDGGGFPGGWCGTGLGPDAAARLGNAVRGAADLRQKIVSNRGSEWDPGWTPRRASAPMGEVLDLIATVPTNRNFMRLVGALGWGYERYAALEMELIELYDGLRFLRKQKAEQADRRANNERMKRKPEVTGAVAAIARFYIPEFGPGAFTNSWQDTTAPPNFVIDAMSASTREEFSTATGEKELKNAMTKYIAGLPGERVGCARSPGTSSEEPGDGVHSA